MTRLETTPETPTQPPEGGIFLPDDLASLAQITLVNKAILTTLENKNRKAVMDSMGVINRYSSQIASIVLESIPDGETMQVGTLQMTGDYDGSSRRWLHATTEGSQARSRFNCWENILEPNVRAASNDDKIALIQGIWGMALETPIIPVVEPASVAPALGAATLRLVN